MPCWSIHLGISYEVNKKLKYDKDLIYFGSVLPDFLDRNYSHYYEENIINFNKFLNDYKENINNPLIIGYYIHLLTDHYYNNIVLNECYINNKEGKLIGIKQYNGEIIYNDNQKECRNIKQNDFKNYGSYLISNNLLDYPKDIDKIYKMTKELNFEINKEKIKEKIDYFKSDEFLNYNTFNGYKLFTKEKYDKIYNDCIKFIINKINNIKL